jgi:hypothetical protein
MVEMSCCSLKVCATKVLLASAADSPAFMLSVLVVATVMLLL